MNILDYVYFETEPMVTAEERGDRLDFSVILNESFYKAQPKKFDRKAIEKLKAKYLKHRKDARPI